ncbi:MAG: EexN family lipoprotein [Pseudomonadota bacterium]
MKVRRLCVLVGAAALLAACSEPSPSRDKAYFAAHETERATQLAACQNDPGRLSSTPNCVNAQAAESDARTARFYDVPKPASRLANPGAL